MNTDSVREMGRMFIQSDPPLICIFIRSRPGWKFTRLLLQYSHCAKRGKFLQPHFRTCLETSIFQWVFS